ncbi:protein phosphatase 2C domain-containing protein [Microbacterium sp. zg.Y1090]|uniref:PP2C family protein-serine/threonine phosphatase n=1 Tax=Microbacterium TaxID=33882 RepID=UPI00214AB50C|nr:MULTISPECIES: protein phosphatase 2C domain-containing protein [unclassified Microbacterium]MCR2812241.1 protein phosphatase 2C domain-containing protein [Microbacterium sp. zg.Y1084]MCR2818321.1 protein phosphatase 2C domain-containing protein [Microbacterium sp. zg.Y1090]MDL5486133.1 protein phosphatase 2C domain-containing protein [Microbacterium sp. zg-Y1211]WIM29342.1 protein phosphatase 2C domain-containing protein [Microbacterium sp. zg-Y1090]
MTAPRTLQVTCGVRTDVGLRRRVNEDAVLAEHPVYIVADGMGGHDAGDLASAAIVSVFRGLVGRTDLTPHDVAAAVDEAHTAVSAIAATRTRGAGSTLTGVVAVRQDGVRRWLVVNIGDSRVYRLLSDRLEQLTVDHSVAQELVDQGRLARREMSSYRGRNVITRAVGEERSRADYWLLPVVTGERLLVCSDGLSGELTDEAIRAGLALGGAPPGTAAALVEQALAHGGRDNISAIVIDVVSGGMSPSQEDTTGGLPAGDDDSATIEVSTLRSLRTRARRG